MRRVGSWEDAPHAAATWNRHFFNWLLAVALLLALDVRAAEPPASVSVLDGESLSIGRFSAHLQLLEDLGGKLTIEDVSREPVARQFVAATLDAANVGFTSSSWWARFTLRNDAAAARQVFVRQSYPLIDYIDLYEPGDGGAWRKHETGDRRAFDTRAIAHRDLLFPLVVPANAERTFYLRYQSQGPIDISLSLANATDLLGSVSREQMAYGVYFGCVIMLLVWAALVFIAVRDRAFLAYFAYVATFGLYMLVNNGLAFQFLWPDSPRWGNVSVIVLLSLALIAGLQFSRMILHARTYTPKLDRVAQGLQSLAILMLVATPFAPYKFLIVPVTALVLTSVIFMLALGIASVASGSQPAKFYLLAWSSFLAGSIVYLLKVFGVVPHTFFTDHSWQIGSLLEMILLSMTLSSRMNELQHQTRTDALTLLGNRRLFGDALQEQFALASQLRRPLSLLVLDIDRFKQYNDRHGHVRGDEAIRVVAHVLRRHLGKPFIACRYGGEEFTVILPGSDGTAAALLAERIRRSVQETFSAERGITVSIGVAGIPDVRFETAEKLFEAADVALYNAKAQGRNCVVSFQERNTAEAEKSPVPRQLAG